MNILKFGGTSISSRKSVYSMLNILSGYDTKGESVILVVSALKNVTNHLIDLIEAIDNQDIGFKSIFNKIKSYHSHFLDSIFKENEQLLIRSKLTSLEREYDLYLTEIFDKCIITEENKDFILGYGELCSAQILQLFLKVNGLDFSLLDSRELVVTDSNYGNANIHWTLTNERIKLFFENNPRNYVVTGFIGATTNGSTTTIGRGGSDYTATIFAIALNAKCVIKWTDVDGIKTADPNMVPNARSLKKISYSRLFSIAKLGKNTLVHPNSLLYLSRENIPLVIRNTFNPEFKGTLVTRSTKEDKHNVISHNQSCSIVSIPLDLEISLHLVKKIISNGHLFFRIKNTEFMHKDRAYYVVSDILLKDFSSYLSCPIPSSKDSTRIYSIEITYRDVTLINIFNEVQNKTYEKDRISRMLSNQSINVLHSRLFNNSISFLIPRNDCLRAVNYIHDLIIENRSISISPLL